MCTFKVARRLFVATLALGLALPVCAPVAADQSTLCDAACLSEAVHGTPAKPAPTLAPSTGFSATPAPRRGRHGRDAAALAVPTIMPTAMAAQAAPPPPVAVAPTPAPRRHGRRVVSQSNYAAPLPPADNVSEKGVMLFTPGLPALPQNAHPTFLPKGVIFAVQTMQSYSSFGALAGGKLRFELVQDVVVNGMLIAMKGDTAVGTIQAGRASGGLPPEIDEGSDLRVSVDKIYNYCGDTIDVDFDRSEYRRLRGNLNFLMLVGVGFFLRPDADVHIIRGQRYAAFSERPQMVCAVPTNQPNSIAPGDALKTTDN